jgi:3-oxoacyl-[acyl-carrier protein] reductase
VNGRTALITGGSRGIGAAIAERFRQAGAQVLTPSRNDLDLFSDASIDGWLARLGSPVDILVNCAGINRLAGVADLSDDDLRDTLQVNLLAPLRLARGLCAGMKSLGYGRILNISSVWSVVYRESRLPYAISKSGINGMTRALAVELAPHGILVNGLAPGYIATDMTIRNNSPEEIDSIRTKIPTGRLGTPEEIAEIAAFLCSAANGLITGQTILADGGYTLT